MIALLFDHLWQSTLFAAATGLLTLVFTRNSAAIRFWLWFAASVKFLVPFFLLTRLGAFLFQAFAPPVPSPVFSSLKPAAMPFSGVAPVLAAGPGFDGMPWLTALWGAGCAVVLLNWTMRWLKLRAVLRAATPLAMAAPLPVKSSAALLEPGLVGIWRPVLLLPQGIAAHLTPPETDAILAHELCHLRRRDNLLAVLHMLVEAVFWFWPPVWWLGARLIAERERACDEAVLASGSDPQTYAETILKVCKFYVQSPLACAAGVSGADLKQRMEEIMKRTIIVRLDIPKKMVLAATAAAVLGLPLATGVFGAPPAWAQGGPHPGTEAALRRQIEGWENKQPVTAEMTAEMARLTVQQRAQIQRLIDGWGALKTIAFRQNSGGKDVYQVMFEHGSTLWTIAPLQNGKIAALHFGPLVERTDNGPSSGLAAAIRRELEGDLSGEPALDIMGPDLQTATRREWPKISATAKSLGAVESISFQKVDVQGWDVYQVAFAHGTATVAALPLVSGKLVGLGHGNIQVSKTP